MKKININIDVYYTKVIVLVGTRAEIIEQLSKKKDVQLSKVVEQLKKRSLRGFATKQINSLGAYIVGIETDNLKTASIESVLVHELFHVTENILTDRKVVLGGEHSAYLIGYLMDKAIKGSIRKRRNKNLLFFLFNRSLYYGTASRKPSIPY